MHIHARYQVCLEAVNIGKVSLKYFPSMETTADTLTKTLGPQKFEV